MSVSDYVRKELIEAGVPSDKITTIYNPPPSWKITEKSKVSSTVILLLEGSISIKVLKC